MPTLSAIYRYPVKGLSPAPMASVTLAAGDTLPLDRAYAIENGTADFDPQAPRHFPKIKYLMLMRDEKLAALSTSFDEDGDVLTLERNGKQVARGALATPVGRKLIEQFLAAYMKDALRGPPRIVSAPGFSFSDLEAKVVSVLNLASVKDLERVVGKPIDALRFRANIHLEGLEPWVEKNWIGHKARLGNVDVEVRSQTTRCAAINVNPSTGERDMLLPRALESAFGANTMGLYLTVKSAGTIREGDEFQLT